MVRALTQREKDIKTIENKIEALTQCIDNCANEIFELETKLEYLNRPGFYIPEGGFVTKKGKGKIRTKTKSTHNRDSKPKDTKESKNKKKENNKKA